MLLRSSFPWFNGGCECSLHRPAIAKPAQYDPFVEPKVLRPFRDAHSLPVVGEEPVGSSVSVLLRLRRPMAIHWPFTANALFALATRVVSVVVLSVNGMFRRWSVSHVRDKRGERCLPAFTNDNSSRSIIGKLLFGRQFAPANHLFPRSVFSGSGCAVGGVATVPTHAAFPVSQVGAADRIFPPAGASAQPRRASVVLTMTRRMKRQNCPLAKCFSSQVYGATSAMSRLLRSHDDAPFIGLARTAKQLQLPGRLHCSTEEVVAT